MMDYLWVCFLFAAGPLPGPDHPAVDAAVLGALQPALAAKAPFLHLAVSKAVCIGGGAVGGYLGHGLHPPDLTGPIQVNFPYAID
jgi:hypothetical protein